MRVIRASREYQDTNALFLSEKINGDGKGGGMDCEDLSGNVGIMEYGYGEKTRGEGRGRGRGRGRYFG